MGYIARLNTNIKALINTSIQSQVKKYLENSVENFFTFLVTALFQQLQIKILTSCFNKITHHGFAVLENIIFK